MASEVNLFRDQQIARQESLRAQSLLSCHSLGSQYETLRSHQILLPSNSANTMIVFAIMLDEPSCCESLSAQTTTITNTFEAWDNCSRLLLR